MIIMSIIVGQIPIILGELLNLIPKIFQYLCSLITKLIKYLFRKKEFKYKYAKNYNQELICRKIGDSNNTTDMNENMMSNKISLYLKYISNINYSKNDALNDVVYNYVPYRSVVYKIPMISAPIEIEPDVYIYYTVESSKNERNHNRLFTINTYTLYIHISLLTNISKDLLEKFEAKMVKDNEDLRYIIDNYQTINYLDKDKDGDFYYKTYQFHTTKSFDNIFLPEKEQIYRVLDTFVNNKNLYCRLGKQYYLGMLLYGLPGCGKTSLIKAIANFTKRDIYIVKLSDIKSNADLESVFKNEKIYINSYIPEIQHSHYCRPFNKRIIVIEDADVDIQKIEDRKTTSLDKKKDKEVTDKLKTNLLHMLDDDKPIDPTSVGNIVSLLMKDTHKEFIGPYKDPKSFDLDVFLNILDGIQEQDGTIFIMTTNYPEKIDKALIRPGRCDIRIEFKLTTSKIILDMIQYYYREDYKETDFVIDGKYLPILENMGDKYTASEICQMLYEHSYASIINHFKTIGKTSQDNKVQVVMLP